MTDVTTRHQQHGAVVHRYRDEGDGTFSHAISTNPRVWDTLNLVWVRQAGDSTGTTTVSSSGGAGGAATIADGADVAQGTTTDASSANTVIGLLKAIKAAITGSVTTTTSWASAQHVIVDTAPTTAVTGPLTDTQIRATPLPVSGTVTTGGLTDTQLRATPVPVSGTVTATTGGLTDTQLRATPVPVSGTVTATTGGLTDTQLRASAVPVSLASAPSTAVTNAGMFAVQDTVLSSSQLTRNGGLQVQTYDDANRVVMEQVLVELMTLNRTMLRLAPSGPETDLGPAI